MGDTLAEKILGRSAGRTVVPGEIITVPVDCAMMDDPHGPWYVGPDLESIGGRVKDPSKVVVICDHFTPSATITQANFVAFTRKWARDNGIANYFESQGPCHQILGENGFDLPGTILVGTDSHTVTAGAFGCFGTGIGSTEMVGVLATGEIWLRVPESIKVVWNGRLSKRVMAKDIALKTVGAIGHFGATYMALEFTGDAFAEMPIDERMCISNMSVETGAKAGLFAADALTEEYLQKTGNRAPYYMLKADPDAGYKQTLTFDASALEPQVACPHAVDNVEGISRVSGTRVNRGYIGSCTGGRISDLAAAAEILKGQKVDRGCLLMISPGSRSVYREALRLGYLETFLDAGAVLLAPTCGACVGQHSGLLGAAEVCVSTTNRNFQGRMGSMDAFVFLGSPATVAASMLTGRLTDPRSV